MEKSSSLFSKLEIRFHSHLKEPHFCSKVVDFLEFFKVSAVNSVDIQLLESWTKDCPTKD